MTNKGWYTIKPNQPGQLLHRVVVPVRVQSMGQIELFNYLTVSRQMADVKLNCWCSYRWLKLFNCVQTKLLVLDNNIWSNLTVCKQMINTKQNYFC